MEAKEMGQDESPQAKEERRSSCTLMPISWQPWSKKEERRKPRIRPPFVSFALAFWTQQRPIE
jgi:hypothetical protein